MIHKFASQWLGSPIEDAGLTTGCGEPEPLGSGSPANEPAPGRSVAFDVADCQGGVRPLAGRADATSTPTATSTTAARTSETRSLLRSFVMRFPLPPTLA